MNLILITGLLASLSSTALGVVAMTQPKPEVVNIDELISLKAEQYGLDSQLVASIVNCESGGIIGAINTNKNGTTDKGLLQINSIHKTDGINLFDPEDNLDFGLSMMKDQGTKPWKSSFKCWGRSNS